MPIGTKTDNTDWITDPFLVKSFLSRLEDVLDANVDLDKTWTEDVRERVMKFQRYSLKQDWALKNIEEKVEAMQNSGQREDDWIFGNDERYFGTLDDTH
jgi:hypothetical protein